MSTLTSCVSYHFSNAELDYAQFISNESISNNKQTNIVILEKENDIFNRLEKENASLKPQESTAFILAQIERQNALLEKDPKSIYIHSNELKAHFTTVQKLVKDNATSLNEDEEEIDWGFWEAVIQDSDQVALKLPHLLSIKLSSGIPARVRGLIWQAMSKSASLHLETVYGQLCKEKSPHERIIQRDLSRTFPRIEMFKQENGNGQISMKKILEAYSLYDPEVGYCQGLAFLVGPLLMNMPETQSFCVFVRLMETYEMRSMFTLHMEGLQLRLYQFTKLFSEILPDLSHHFETHSVHAAMYASQWFLTLFAYAFPIHLVTRIYDIIFAEGAAETIMRVAIAILKRSEQIILTQMLEFEEILDFVTSRKLCLPYADNYTNVIRDAMALSPIITREKLDKLRSEYAMEQKRPNKPGHVLAANRTGFWKRRASKPKGSDMKRASTIHPTKTPKPALINTQPVLRKRWSSVSTQEWTCDTKISPTFVDEACVTAPCQRRTSFSSLCSFNSVHNPSLPLTPKSLPDGLQGEMEKLKVDHQRALDELRELRYNKEDLECERDALKLTILELERRYFSKEAPESEWKATGSPRDPGLAGKNSDFKGDSACDIRIVESTACFVYEDLDAELVQTKVRNFELEQHCEKLCHELDHIQSKYDMVSDGQMALVDKLLTTKADMDELMEEKKKKNLEWLESVQMNKTLELELTRTKQLLDYFELENQYLIRNYPVNNLTEKHNRLSRRHSLSCSTLPNVSDQLLGNFWIKLYEQKQQDNELKQVYVSTKKSGRISRASSFCDRVLHAIKPKY